MGNLSLALLDATSNDDFYKILASSHLSLTHKTLIEKLTTHTYQTDLAQVASEQLQGRLCIHANDMYSYIPNEAAMAKLREKEGID